jgi:hypothetical protein
MVDEGDTMEAAAKLETIKFHVMDKDGGKVRVRRGNAMAVKH